MDKQADKQNVRTVQGAIAPIRPDSIVIQRPGSLKPPFVALDKKDMQEAMKCLSGDAFKLYMYLSSNMDGFEINCRGSKWLQNETGIAGAAYENALAVLALRGYLVSSAGRDDSGGDAESNEDGRYLFRCHPELSFWTEGWS